MHSGAVVKCQMCVSVDHFRKDVFARHELCLTKPICLGYACSFCHHGSTTVWVKKVSFTALPGSEFRPKFDMLLLAELQAQAYWEAVPYSLFFVLLWQIHRRQKCQENIRLFIWCILCNWSASSVFISINTSFTLCLSWNGSVTDRSQWMLCSPEEGYLL